jgi:hypothetical protein
MNCAREIRSDAKGEKYIRPFAVENVRNGRATFATGCYNQNN